MPRAACSQLCWYRMACRPGPGWGCSLHTRHSVDPRDASGSSGRSSGRAPGRSPMPTPATGAIRPAPRFCSDGSTGSRPLPSATRSLPPRTGPCTSNPLRPRHPDDDHAVLRALHPRDVADQEGLVAPGVQVTPFAAARIVARARLAAVRTPQRASPGPVQLHPKLLRLPRRLHPRDLPLRTQVQNGIQPFSPGPVCEFLSVSWDRCRWRVLRSLTTQSPPSPAIPKGSPMHSSPVQQQYPWLGCPTKPLCVEWAKRPSSRRRHARLAIATARQPSHDSNSDAHHPAQQVKSRKC